MRASYSRLFQTHPELLEQMLVLRLSGWSLHALKDLYDCDRTTIRHWIVKFDIKPQVPEIPYRMLPQVTINYTPPQKEVVVSKYKYQHIFDEEECVNPGKSYKEYIADHKRRDPKYRFVLNPYASEY